MAWDLMGHQLLAMLLGSGLCLTKMAMAGDAHYSFVPAAPLSSQAYYNTTLNTWGGSAIATKGSSSGSSSASYHLFMSALTGSLQHWTTQSYIVRAVADRPEGPYILNQTMVLPVFHHNPAVVQAHDGTYLMFTIGPRVFNTELHYSRSIEGPWTSIGVVINGSNPSPYAMANGSIAVAYKAIPNGLRIATAKHWGGPYTTLLNRAGSELLLPATSVGCDIEDYDLWFDGERRRWYSLTHQYNFTLKRGMQPGGVLYSEGTDLHGPWHLSSMPAYDYNPQIRGQLEPLELIHRERPKRLIVGNVTYLFNGAALAPAHDESGYGKTFTFVQQVASWNPPGVYWI